MGVSLALVFHVTSAIVVLLLAGWGLRLQRDLRFLRAMIAFGQVEDGDPRMRRIADVPERFIARMARAFGVRLEGHPSRAGSSGDNPVTAILPAPLARMFLRGQVSLIQFAGSGTVVVHVAGRGFDAASHAELLARSFGGSVTFKLLEAGESHEP